MKLRNYLPTSVFPKTDSNGNPGVAVWFARDDVPKLSAMLLADGSELALFLHGRLQRVAGSEKISLQPSGDE